MKSIDQWPDDHTEVLVHYLQVLESVNLLFTYTLFFYKNIFYKNIEAEIREILRIF